MQVGGGKHKEIYSERVCSCCLCEAQLAISFSTMRYDTEYDVIVQGENLGSHGTRYGSQYPLHL
jgi:hypothetical protein